VQFAAKKPANASFPNAAALFAGFQGLAPGILRLRAKFLLNAQQLIIFRGPIGTRK
jgi:hypothetical protein